jgi:DNA-binding CsgD family transcriptional regulator
MSNGNHRSEGDLRRSTGSTAQRMARARRQSAAAARATFVAAWDAVWVARRCRRQAGRCRAGGCRRAHCIWQRLARRLCASPRQTQVMRRMLLHEKETQIACALGISGSAVHMHIRRLYRKLKVHTRSELVMRVVQECVGFGLSGATVPPSAASTKTRHGMFRLSLLPE